ncbi:glycosyltransferase [Micromonospora psammae]|uniref:glycosyltransferase n=1 Tax=Micromonospora sp. CPCC 205556 TaxID=3122398 RepID=UPI002FF0EAB2
MTTVSVVIISKNERGLDDTLRALAPQCVDMGAETIVVDASNGALDDIAEKHPGVRWIKFTGTRRDKRITIPEQRNAGVRAATGEVIVFIDCGCVPEPGWLRTLTGPILAGDEEIVTGPTPSRLRASVYDAHVDRRATRRYVDECPTGNLAFTRRAFDAVRGFDESFDYGSDIDISWRWRAAGFRILSSEAVVRVDWGTAPRQVKRSFLWGAGRARLYVKHRNRLRELPRRDPIVLAYPLFMLGLPVMLLSVYWPVAMLYPALVVLPLWRNRRHQPLQTVVGHFAYGAGVLWQLGRRGNPWS